MPAKIIEKDNKQNKINPQKGQLWKFTYADRIKFTIFTYFELNGNRYMLPIYIHNNHSYDTIGVPFDFCDYSDDDFPEKGWELFEDAVELSND